MCLWLFSQLGGMIHLLTTPPDNMVTQAPLSEQTKVAENDNTPDVPTKGGSPATDPSRSGTGIITSSPEALPRADTTSAAVPEAGEVAQVPVETTQGRVAPVLDAANENPIQPGVGITAPMQPVLDGSPQVAQAAPLPATQQPVVSMPETPVMPDVDSEGRVAVADSTLAPVEPIQPNAPVQDTLPQPNTNQVAVLAPEPEPAPAPVPVPQTTPEPEPVTQPVPQPEPASELAPEPAPAPVVVAEQTPEPAPETPPVPDPAPEIIAQAEPEPAPEISPVAPVQPVEIHKAKPANATGTFGSKVRTNRLPTIGGAQEPATETPETPETAPEESDAPAPEGPAIEIFAAEFENPENRPLMSIILIDEGGARPSLAELQEFPFPVSYVVDANRPDAAAAMSEYRAAGNEVIALAPLPRGATPADVEVSFQTYIATMPEVVALMDTREAVFQSGRQVTTQVAEILAATGHGMITYSRGMNAATQVASREGVPAQLVFREFDNDGQDGRAIKRFLDQAAFRAGQQSGVILVGHTRPETIKAIVEWGLGNKAETVALAPVSAALLAK